MKALFATLFVSLLAINSAYAAPFAEATGAEQSERKDLQVFNGIADQVNRYTQLTIFDSISAQVDDGRVVLTGWVTMPFKRDDLEKRVRKGVLRFLCRHSTRLERITCWYQRKLCLGTRFWVL